MGLSAIPVLLDSRACRKSIKETVQVVPLFLEVIGGEVLGWAGGRGFGSCGDKLGVFVNPFD